ncbi:DNA polymerase II large subunit [Candidatus Woesearchaeota archaeon]|nr:DNA polymerase II large subunit [Candidatus Woesearchaeota archaeon]
MIVASPKMHEYFSGLKAALAKSHDVATLARQKHYDPAPDVEIKLAENMAERVVGLISVLAPQIVGSGVVERIIELETKYAPLDWRVAFTIAAEVAAQKFCKFKDEHESIDIGIRTGFAYVTVGVVSSPLDGIVSIDFKDRLDKRGKYLAVSFAGPIRNAGGTAAAVSILIADHVRTLMGYDVYDASQEEIRRAYTELQDYHERVTNLQYFPSEDELAFLMRNMPVEVAGEPSEKIEVSNYKDLPRIPTNAIRSGFCLVMSSCIPLKAPKLWKQLGKWGKEFRLEHWGFLEEFLKLQKKAKAGDAQKENKGITPDYTYMADLVAGRPVFSHPLAAGGFRLRYGRSRASGLSAQGIHPATMQVLDDYLATGTQLKVERPGKAAAYTPCDTIDGPIVKLDDGSVVKLSDEHEARRVRKRISEILFLGDILIDYGDFANRNHPLVPAGYCPEWWVKELERESVTKFGTISAERIASWCKIPEEKIQAMLTEPLHAIPSPEESLILSRMLNVPLHPEYTFHWADISKDEFSRLYSWIAANASHEKLVLPMDPAKRVLELIGCPHTVVQNENVVIAHPYATPLLASLGLDAGQKTLPAESPLKSVNILAGFCIRDKSGVYIGARMGRPEKAKLRKLTGSPNCIFPVGDEGGRLRSLQAAMEIGHVTADFPLAYCPACKTYRIFQTCEVCGTQTQQHSYCKACAVRVPAQSCPRHGETLQYELRSIAVNELFKATVDRLRMTAWPDLIKGVRGTSSDRHIPEHLAKGVLRAKHDLAVNKDGTIRYDCSELAITHFRPREIGTGVAKLRELGYTADIHGAMLEHDDQLVELKPQDVILPACPTPLHEPSDAVLLKISQFLDDLLERFYGLPRFYNATTRDDIIGHLIIGLAPHTSAGMLGRIIGFTRTQGFLAHPYFHQACRRDCDGDEIGFLLLLDGFINFSRIFLPSTRGSTMDAPLVLSSVLIPTEVDDQAFDVGIAWQYPLELYEASVRYAMPGDVKLKQVKSVLNTPAQYEGMGFTHDTADVNAGVLCSAYKTLPSMDEKIKGQMALAIKIRACDTADVARLVIEKHLLKDTRGNLRKFSTQEFRCVSCNTKYRRPLMMGKCDACGGRLLFTVSEGSVVKYLQPTIDLAKTYAVSHYLKQCIDVLQRRIESIFGKDKEKQTGLGSFMASRGV